MRDRSASAGFALSASGTNAVDMKTIGKKRSVIVLVACSLLVSNAGMKPAPTNAIPNAPDSRRIKRNPPIPVSILVRNTSPTMSTMPDRMAAWKNVGTISPARIDQRLMGLT